MIEIIPNWHPVVVHFTIALLSVSVGFYALAIIFKNNSRHEHWLMFANWSLWLGTGFALLTATAGWFAYNSVAHDTPSHAAMTTHRDWALVTLAVFVLLAIWSFLLQRKGMKPAVLFLLVSFAGAGLLATTGWLGGEAVYRYGLGVMSIPKSEGEGHAHSHGEGAGHEDAGQQKTNPTPSVDGHSDGHSDNHSNEGHGHDDKMQEHTKDQPTPNDHDAANSKEHNSDGHAH